MVMAPMNKVMQHLKLLGQSQLRSCGCCGKLTLFLSVSRVEEFNKCIRCQANLRYEMLSHYIRSHFHLASLAVVELDPASPLRQLLNGAASYLRTYYSAVDQTGSYRSDGSRCEDITQLSLTDNSIDLMISSDVLEHVPDLDSAFREMHRVLKPGGSHVFTVPPKLVTVKRAEPTETGDIRHFLVPEYHGDPLAPGGILVYWDFGNDAETRFSTAGLDLKVVAGPCGTDGRIIWSATKTGSVYQ
jgi:hypothetical protein